MATLHFASRQVQEMHEQAAAQTTEVRKLYDWRDVMKSVHNEKLQELAEKHHAERDSLLRVTSQRSATRHTGQSCNWQCMALVAKQNSTTSVTESCLHGRQSLSACS